MSVSLSRVTGSGDGGSSSCTRASPKSIIPRGTTGCYCTRPLRLGGMLIQSSVTSCLLRILVVVIELARDPRPRRMRAFIFASTGSIRCCRLPINRRCE